MCGLLWIRAAPGLDFAAVVGGRACAFAAVAATVVGALGASLHAATGDPIRVTAGTQLSSGQWRRLARASSPRTKAAALARGFVAAPTALAFTVTATPAQRVRLFWSVYCEGYANDEIFAPQGSFKYRAAFTAYPPLLTNAAKCFVTVRATPTRAGKAHAVVFGY
jgi:hypothetical protein